MSRFVSFHKYSGILKSDAIENLGFNSKNLSNSNSNG